MPYDHIINTRSPFCPNKSIHLRATTKNAHKYWLTDLFCLTSKARYSFKQIHLVGADVMSGAELVPQQTVIVHGWVVKVVTGLGEENN